MLLALRNVLVFWRETLQGQMTTDIQLENQHAESCLACNSYAIKQLITQF